MVLDRNIYDNLITELTKDAVTLVAVSKIKPPGDIRKLYDYGQRDFGENYVQELVEKQNLLPGDIRWHFIGHLQRNKVKYIAPFVFLIHGVDSFKLLKEIDKEASKNNRVIQVLLQVHIATEETKFGFDENELEDTLKQADALKHIEIKGLMGMASFSEDQTQVAREFQALSELYKRHQQAHHFSILSMGMSSDYTLAIANGSTMVRIGSLLFGARTI